MSFTNLKDFKELREATKFCEDPIIRYEDCPFVNIEEGCSERFEQGETESNRSCNQVS